MAAANRTGFWNDAVWASLDDGVSKAVNAVRVIQRVFPTVQLPDVTSVPADQFDPGKMSITEGATKPYAELAVQFTLTSGQVASDPTGTTAITLAKFAAKDLALAEDLLILQGDDAKSGLPPTVRIESGGHSLGKGILGLVHHRTITVPDSGDPVANSGAHILAAVAQGIAALSKEMQAPPYALLLDTDAFASTWGSVINGAPAYTVLNPVLTGGIYGTGAMPANTGLLIALGGDPTTVYFGNDPVTEPTHRDGSGMNHFRTFERVQFVARDPRAFVRLEFPRAGSTRTGASSGSRKGQTAQPET
jgi:uncharacterized linocin/CFP29 family protein